MEGLGKGEGDAEPISHIGHITWLQVQRKAKLFQAVGCAALAGSGPVPVLDDPDPGCGSDDGTHGRQVDRCRPIAACSDNVGHVSTDLQRHRVPHHGPGSPFNLLAGQPQGRLHGQDGTHLHRVGIPIHQVVHVPLGLIRAQMPAGHQRVQDGFPGKWLHDDSFL